jgi:hypothetical protein
MAKTFERITIRPAENGYTVEVEYPPKPTKGKGNCCCTPWEPPKPHLCRDKKELSDYVDTLIVYKERAGSSD